jgi:TRAP-type C4-dicarboxylate transport system permease small subunit
VRVLDLLCRRVFAPVAAGCLFLMMALTIIEVVSRYFLNAPITGVEEVKAFLLGFTVFAALPLVTRQRRHIAVRSLAELLRGRARTIQRVAVAAGTVAGLGFVAFLLLDQAGALAEAGTLTNFLDLKVAPAVYAFAAFAGCAALVALEQLVRGQAGGGGSVEPSGPE